MKWLRPVLWLSLLGNGLIGGDIHESLSARAGYAREHGSVAARRACVVLNWLDPRVHNPLDHCTIAINEDKIRRKQ